MQAGSLRCISLLVHLMYGAETVDSRAIIVRLTKAGSILPRSSRETACLDGVFSSQGLPDSFISQTECLRESRAAMKRGDLTLAGLTKIRCDLVLSHMS